MLVNQGGIYLQVLGPRAELPVQRSKRLFFSSSKDGLQKALSLCRMRNLQSGAIYRHGWRIRHISVFGIVAELMEEPTTAKRTFGTAVGP